MSVNSLTIDLAIDAAIFVTCFIFGSLVEYWAHRLMHKYPKIFAFHLNHHKNNEGQGVLGEFRDYFKGGVILLLPLFLYSWSVGLSWFLGGVTYGIFAAYAHQLQHENPSKCFWMKMPVHYVHHKYNQWNYNFGLGVDWWDIIFGTYKEVEWLTEKELSQPERGMFQVRWW